MKTKFFMAIAIAVVTVMTASAQPQRGQLVQGLNRQEERQVNRSGGFSLPMGKLDEKQREEFQKIRTAQMKENTQFRNLLREKRAKLEVLQTADKPEMKEINKVIDEIAAIQAQEMKSQAANRQKIRSLLTEEQRVRFDAIGANRGDMRSEMGNRRFGNENFRSEMGRFRSGTEGFRPGMSLFRSESESFRPGMGGMRPDARFNRQVPPEGRGIRGQMPERIDNKDSK